ncbi:hypothetical protein F4804DRAFT_347534 [Jackrogersella minutella]|nr:hypothetical protein F4804DRAFT_347534 [Jackrogersella minutella]
MTTQTRTIVPEDTRVSYGIELECLVAWLPTGELDPLEDELAHNYLPPLLRVDSNSEQMETDILHQVSDILNSYGIPTRIQSDEDQTLATNNDVPLRLRDIDTWLVSANNRVGEYFLDAYQWQGLEIRSPAMWAEDEATEVVQFVVNLLTSTYRIRVNPTCDFNVHVGNGTEFFSTDAMKRLGGFLWAADPMLSRLHAPYRRMKDSCRTIRHESNLARDTAGRSAETSPRRSGSGGDDGDNDRGNRNNNNRNNSDSNSDNDKSSDDSNRVPSEYMRGPGSDYNEDSEPEFGLPLFQDALRTGRQLLAEDLSIEVPADTDTLSRNIGWVRWDKLQDPVVAEWLYNYCMEMYGHTDVHTLKSEEQIILMLRTQCALLFNHSQLKKLTQEEEHEVVIASAAYFEASRSSQKWDPVNERWELLYSRIGGILEHPAARREIKIDASHVVQRFENLVKLTELDNDDNLQGIEYLNREEYDRSMSINRGVENLLESLKDYAESPSPHFRDNLADPNDHVFQSSSGSEQSTSSPFHATPRNPKPKDSGSRDHSIPPPSPPNPPSESSDDPNSSFEVGSDLSRPRSFFRPSPAAKLQPHDPDAIGASYKAAINEYLHISAEDWNRMDYLPASTNPLGAAAPFAFENLAPHAVPHAVPRVSANATTERGVGALASCGSAAEVADLLSRVGVRLNYNLMAYTRTARAVDRLRGPGASRNRRTVEFRESVGSLDPEWVATWSGVCAGVVRWARSASVAEYMHVLAKVVRQEQRELARKAARGAPYADRDRHEAERYDVCDLLEDLGMFAAAEWVRVIEQVVGPPR